MFGTQDHWLFALTVLLLNATPGVDLLFTLTRTLQFGVGAGVAAALGITTGCVLHALAAAFGLAALLAASVEAFTLIKWAGAAYLLWLAWGMLGAARSASAARAVAVPQASHAPHSLHVPRARHASHTAQTSRTPDTQHQPHSDARPASRAIFRQGLLTNALNPKVALFFLALLPQFISASAANKEEAFLFLGAWFVLQGGAFLLLFVACVAPLRRWSPPPGVQRGLHAGGAALFAWLAARLVMTEGAS